MAMVEVGCSPTLFLLKLVGHAVPASLSAVQQQRSYGVPGLPHASLDSFLSFEIRQINKSSETQTGCGVTLLLQTQLLH